MNPEWKEKLSKAGFKHDGHVTNGSLQEQVSVIDKMLEENKKISDEMFYAFIEDIRKIGLQCLAGGHKNRNRMFQSLADRYKYIYDTGQMDILKTSFKGYKL